MMKRCLFSIAAMATALLALPVHAQQWPTQPVRLIVPFSAGGSTDTVARVLSEKLAPRLGQPVLVENKGGAGGTLGTEAAARAAPDGYTYVIGTASTFAIAPHIYKELRYEPMDFTPVTLLGIADILVVVSSRLPIHSTGELLAYARANPGKLTFASAGVGSISHLLGEYFRSMAKIDMLHVPYKGDANIVPDLIAGQVSMSFGTAVGYMPHVKSGKVVAIAVTNPSRSTSLPELPTVSESGVPGYEAVQWFGVSAPKDTPAQIVQRMHAEIKAILAMPDVVKRFRDLGFDAKTSDTPRQYGEFIGAENAKWKKIAESSNIERL